MFCTVPATRPSAYSILSKGRAPCEDKLTIELTKKNEILHTEVKDKSTANLLRERDEHHYFGLGSNPGGRDSN
jgi:hypothetical protein